MESIFHCRNWNRRNNIYILVMVKYMVDGPYRLALIMSFMVKTIKFRHFSNHERISQMVEGTLGCDGSNHVMRSIP